MSVLERIEWTNFWAENCDGDVDKERVLLIGDSISTGYRRPVQNRIAASYNMTNYATAKAVDNPYYCDELRVMVMQNGAKYPIVHFNNGLHGFHLSIDEYEREYRRIVEFLTATFEGSRIVLALSTPVMRGDNLSEYGERNAVVLERNRAVMRIAEDLGLEVDDLYSAVNGHPEYWSADGVHYNSDGYEVLADQVVRSLFE